MRCVQDVLFVFVAIIWWQPSIPEVVDDRVDAAVGHGQPVETQVHWPVIYYP